MFYVYNFFQHFYYCKDVMKIATKNNFNFKDRYDIFLFD